MLAKTLVVFHVWSPDIFVIIFIIIHFQALFILLSQIKHYHTIPYHFETDDVGRFIVINYQISTNYVRTVRLINHVNVLLHHYWNNINQVDGMTTVM